MSTSGSNIKGGRGKATATRLQIIVGLAIVVITIYAIANSIVTYGSDNRPSDTIFKNSQSLAVFDPTSI